MAASPSISIAIIGSGGAGALTTGDSLLETACAAGWHGLFTRTMGPQIRGGEAAALLRLAGQPVESLPDRFDLLIGIDWLNAHRFGAEIKAGPQTPGDQRPARRRPAADGDRIRRPRRRNADEGNGQGHSRRTPQHDRARHRRRGCWALPSSRRSRRSQKRLADKGPAAIEASLAGIKAGFGAAAGIDFGMQLAAPKPSTARRWLLSGNEATALGAIRGGVRFAAAYPITPATEILEWLAPNLTKVGGTLLQAEDELAAINMIIGSSYGGTPALTATSGPGLSLMIEALGLATCRGNPGRRRRRDARRTLDRHPHQVRAGRPEHRHLRHARRRAASRAGAAIGRRLRVHDAMGDLSRGSAAGPGDRSVRPVHGPVARRHRTAGRRRLHRRTGRRHRYCRRFLQAPRHDGQRRVADGHSGNARRPIYGRRPHPFRARHPDQRRRRPSGPARQAARQARSLQLRRPLGERRRQRRSCRHHLGFAHRRRARSGRPRGRGWNRSPHDRAAPAGAGPAGTDGGRA